VQEQALYWVDCLTRELFRWVQATKELTQWPLTGIPGSFAFCADGRLLFAYRNGLTFFDPATGQFSAIPVDKVDFSVERFNDGKCDARGRFWVGTMDKELKRTVGSLYRVDAGVGFCRMDDSFLTLSNGITWSPDGSTMYLCDSRPGKILRYDYDLESGTIKNRQVFIDYTERVGRPDGCTTDAEGGIWVAEFDAGQIARFDPNGHCERVIELPVSRPTSVAFGGNNLDMLFITSMRHGVDIAEEPSAGDVFVADPGVNGMAPTPFVL
jgi:sugar lactone lactonase YvrE